MVARTLAVVALLATLVGPEEGAAYAPPRVRARGTLQNPQDPSIVALQVTPAVAGTVPPTIRGISSSSDGGVVYLGSPDGIQVLKIESATGRVLRSAQSSHPVNQVALSPDGALLAALSTEGATVALLSASELERAGTLVVGSGAASLKFSPDGLLLYVACGFAKILQVFDLTNGNLVQALSLDFVPADVAILAGGSKVAVGFADSAQLLLLDAMTLQPERSISVPAGTSHLCSPEARPGVKSVLVVGSTLSDLVTVLDAETFDVLKSIAISDPVQVEGGGDLAFVARSGKIDAVEVDSGTAGFGERRATAFVGQGISGIGVARDPGDVLAQSLARTELIRVSVSGVRSNSRSESVMPERGLPGTWVTLRGRYSPNPSPLFMRDESFQARGDAVNATSESFETEIPLTTALGRSQVWVSDSSSGAIDRGCYLAGSPVDFTTIGPIELLVTLVSEVDASMNASTTPAGAVESLRTAVEELRRARGFLSDGAAAPALRAVAAAFDAIESAAALEAAMGRALRTTVEVVQYVVFAKLAAVKKLLSAEDRDVAEAARAFDAARRHLLAGRLRQALDAFRRSFESVEAAMEKARRLTAAQAARVLRQAYSELRKLGHGIHDRELALARPGLSVLGLDAAEGHLGGHGRFRAAALGELARLRLRDAIARMREVVSDLATAGGGTEDLRRFACETLIQMLAAIADAVESNVGPFDQAVTKARRCLALCESYLSASDFTSTFVELERALGEALPASSTAPSVHLFQATGTDTTPCVPKVKVLPLGHVCLDPSASSPERLGRINPNPFEIRVQVTADTPGATGFLSVAIKRTPGGQAIRHLDTRFLILPTLETYLWNGRDDASNIVTLKGAANQDQFVVEAEFVCFSSEGDGQSDLDQEEFTITRVGGLVIVPPRAKKCASTATKSVTQQFRAFKCKEGTVMEDVTEQARWSLDNPAIGEIGATTGLFRATVDGNGKGEVSAVLPGAQCRGEAKVTVTPERGGIVEPSVQLCVNGTFDFDVVKGCDAAGDATSQEDSTYSWTVSDPSLGSISQSGFFTALAAGTVTVTAQKSEELHTATVQIRGVDTIDIVTAPTKACVSDATSQPFVVQVFCNGMPQGGVAVSFSTNGGVTFDPTATVTDGAGLASTQVRPTGVPSPGPASTKLIAQADGLSATAAMTISDIDQIVVVQAPSTACVTDTIAQIFKVQILCQGQPQSGINVTFSTNGGVTFNPADVMTDAGGFATTQVLPTGVPSAAVGSTTLIAQARSLTATANMTIYSITVAIAPPEAICANGADQISAVATMLPSGIAVWSLIGDNAQITAVVQGGVTSTATLRAKTTGGTTTVRVQIQADPVCFAEAKLDVVRIENIAFDKQALCADGVDMVTATATVVPNGRKITWSISARLFADDTTINPATGVLTAGVIGGIVEVQAADSVLPHCVFRRDIDVVRVRILNQNPTVSLGGTLLLLGDIFPPDRTIVWTIQGNALGSTLTPVPFSPDARLAAGSTTGSVVVRAADSVRQDCFDQVTVEIVPAPPPPKLKIRAVSDFIVPFSSLNLVRYDVDDPLVKFEDVVIEILDNAGRVIRVLDESIFNGQVRTTGKNVRVLWNGLQTSNVPLTEQGSPYTYRMRGTDTFGRVVVSNEEKAELEEHSLAFILSDFSQDRKRDLTGRVDPLTVVPGSTGSLDVSVQVDSDIGILSPTVTFDIQTEETDDGQEMFVFLGDLQTDFTFAPRKFYTTPTKEAQILYSVMAQQVGQRVRDISGNVWDMDPETETADRLEDKATLRFDINAKKHKSSLTRNMQVTIEETGAKVPPTPNPPGILRTDD